MISAHCFLLLGAVRWCRRCVPEARYQYGRSKTVVHATNHQYCNIRYLCTVPQNLNIAIRERRLWQNAGVAGGCHVQGSRTSGS